MKNFKKFSIINFNEFKKDKKLRKNDFGKQRDK